MWERLHSFIQICCGQMIMQQYEWKRWTLKADVFDCAAVLNIEINTILLPAHDSSEWMNIKYKVLLMNNRASQRVILLSADCSLLDNKTAITFHLQLCISVCHLLSTPCAEPSSSIPQYSGWNIFFKLKGHNHTIRNICSCELNNHSNSYPCNIKLVSAASISLRLWNNIWCIRLWNVCLSSAPKRHLPEQLLLWLHKDLGQI